MCVGISSLPPDALRLPLDAADPQVYGGLVLMSFDPAHMQQHGRGRYRSLDPAVLPPLQVIYSAAGPSGKDSGAVHSDVRQRWLAGDAGIRCEGSIGARAKGPPTRDMHMQTASPLPLNATCREGMRQVAALAELGAKALAQRDLGQLAALMRENFKLRRQMYGDHVVGADNIRMVELAASVGAAAKLTGSGGAVVALCPEGEAQAARLRQACRQAGLECVPAEVGPVLHVANDEAG